MCKPQHASLAFGVFKPSHSSKHVCAKNSLKFTECQNVALDKSMSQKAIFTWTSKYTSLLPKQPSLIFMQSLHWSGKHWLESTPLHEHLSQQKHDHFPLRHCNHLQVAWVMSLWVDIHVGLMFIVVWLWMNEFGGINVDGKNHSSTKNGLLEVKG